MPIWLYHDCTVCTGNVPIYHVKNFGSVSIPNRHLARHSIVFFSQAQISTRFYRNVVRHSGAKNSTRINDKCSEIMQCCASDAVWSSYDVVKNKYKNKTIKTLNTIFFFINKIVVDTEFIYLIFYKGKNKFREETQIIITSSYLNFYNNDGCKHNIFFYGLIKVSVEKWTSYAIISSWEVKWFCVPKRCYYFISFKL